MVLRVERENNIITIPNGVHNNDYETMRKLLMGHPNGIIEIDTNPIRSNISIESWFSVLPPNDEKMKNPVKILGMNTARVEIGQKYGHSGNVMEISLSGDSSFVTINLLDEEMTFRHSKR